MFGSDLNQFVLGFFEFEFAVYFGRGQENMATRAFRVFQRFADKINVLTNAARQSADDGLFNFSGKFLDGFDFTGRSGRKTGFDDIDVQPLELLGDLLPIERSIESQQGSPKPGEAPRKG